MADSRRELVLKAIVTALEVASATKSVPVVDEGAAHDSSGLILGYSSQLGYAQSFRPSGPTVLSESVSFVLDKIGAPTGDMVAKIYAATGTHGTDAKPTGTAIATSAAIDAGTLSVGSWSETVFTFASPVTINTNTTYCVAIEYSSGNASNYVRVGKSTLPHAGNYSQLSADWAAGGFDLVFTVAGIAPTMAKPSGLSVHRHFTRMAAQPDLPDVTVFVAGEEPSEKATDTTTRRMLVRVRCRVKAAAGVSGDEALDPVLVWAELAVLDDHTLGGLSANIESPDIDAVSAREYAETFAEATLQFPVVYETKWGDPRQAP